MKILYVQPNGIGNTIMSTPAMQAIRVLYPNAQYELMINPSSYDVVNGWYLFDRIFKEGRSNSSIQYDLAILAEPGKGSVLEMSDIRAKKVITHKNSPYRTRVIRTRIKHEVLVNMEIAVSLGYNDKIPPLYLNAAPNNPSYRIYKDKIAIHIGTVGTNISEKKKWTLEKWIELIKKLGPEKCFIIGSRNEISDAKTISDITKIMNACSRFTIPETATILKHSRMLITTDSGPMHIAAAMGTPVVALFGGTSIDKNHPWMERQKFRIVKSGCLCSPCQFTLRFKTCNNYKCMQSITVEQVFNSAKEIYKNIKNAGYLSQVKKRKGLCGINPKLNHLRVIYDVWSHAINKVRARNGEFVNRLK